jgi:hypothetical protein
VNYNAVLHDRLPAPDARGVPAGGVGRLRRVSETRETREAARLDTVALAAQEPDR